MWDFLLRASWWCICSISSSRAYQSDAPPPLLMIEPQFCNWAMCVPSPHKLPPLGVRGLWKSLGALLIAIRIRNVPAQIIHINNWNKNITLYIRLTATPRTKLTVYKNSYVKNLHKRQTKGNPQCRHLQKKNQTKHNVCSIIMATKTCCYCLQFHFIVWLEIIL